LETCAVDGLCAGACPVDINTGDLVKRLRRESHSAAANRVAMLVARNFSLAERITRTALSTGAAINRLFGRQTMTKMTRLFRKIAPPFPIWPVWLSGAPGLPKRAAIEGAQRIVYVPSCVSRMLKTGSGDSVMDALIRVAGKIGIGVILPDPIQGVCCGQVFSSKGYAAAYRYKANRMVELLWGLSQQGRHPVVMDVSSCTHTMLQYRDQLEAGNRRRFDVLQILDTVDFLSDMVLPLTPGIRGIGDVVLHPVCSLQKMNKYEKFLAVARHFAATVTVPLHAGCCGMAGDRGFFFPELTIAATQREAAEVRDVPFEGHYSSAVSCELALAEATGREYVSIVHLVDRALG
jgi:D-lactate dehydrogenase